MPGYNPLGNDYGPSPPKPQGSGSLEPYWPAGYPIPQQTTMYQAPPAAPMPQYYSTSWYPTYPAYPTYPTYQAPWVWPAQQPSNPLPTPPAPPKIQNHPPPVNTVTPQPNRQATSGHARDNRGMPGSNLQNWQGGTGNIPGWNYMFGTAAHAPIIFIKSGRVRPWSNEFISHSANPKNMVTLEPYSIRTTMTVKELLAGAGATNENPKKNVVVEVVSQGNGRWKRGLCIHGDDKRAGKTIAEMGWHEKRTGILPANEYTYLYVTSDTLYTEL